MWNKIGDSNYTDFSVKFERCCDHTASPKDYISTASESMN